MIRRVFSTKKPIGGRFFGAVLFSLISMQSHLALAQVLNLEQAVQNALQQHPSLSAYDFRIKSADADIAQARIGERKSIDLNVQNALGTGDLSGFDETETTLTVAWVLEDDILDARRQRARDNKSLIELQKQIKRLDIASETATRFITALIYQQKLKVAEQWQHDASAMYLHIAKRVDAGKSLVADKYRASAQHSLSRLELEDIHHEIETAYVQLSALWGQSTPSFKMLTGEVAKIGELPAFSVLKTRLQANPDLDIFLTRERIAQSEINLAKTESKNRWRFNAGLKHAAATDDVGLVAGVTIPLGSEKRSRGRVAALTASMSAYRSEATALQVQLQADLFELYQAYQHAVHVITVLSGQTIPDIERALTETRKAYDLGRSGFQEWTLVQQELLQSKVNLLEAYYQAHIKRIEIERLTGTSIVYSTVD